MNKKKILTIIGALAAIAIISIAYFYPDAFEGNVLGQHDMVQGVAMGHEIAQVKAETGHTPLWTNAAFSGMPTYQNAPYYASTRMFSWIGKAYGLFLPQPANLLAMMMIGMFILLLTFKVKPWMSLVGAVAWGLSSYFVIIIGAGHLWKFYALSYIPPTIAGLVLIYNGRRLLGAALAALFMALQIAANHFQMTYYFAFVMAAMVIAYGVSALREKKLRRWGINTVILAGAMLLGVAANAPSLYHTYEYSKLSTRGGHSELTPLNPDDSQATSGLDRDYITAYSYGRGETLSLLIPDVVGGASAMPKNGQVVGLTLADTPEGRELMARNNQMTLLQLFSPYFGGAEGTNGPVYVGAIIVMLFIFGALVVKGPMKWALVIMTLFSILLALGRNLQWFTDLFIDYMPMYSRFRAVESILVIAEFTMPLLAILGLREFFSSDNRKAMLRPLAISAAISASLCLIVMAVPSVAGATILGERDLQTIGQYIAAGALPQDFNITLYPAVLQAVESMRASAVRTDALRSLAFIFAALLPMLFMAKGSLKPAAALAIIGIAIGIDLFTADKRYLNSASFTTPPPGETIAMTPADKAILADTALSYRVLDGTRFYVNDPSYYHKSIGGYHAAKLARYQDLIERHLGFLARPEAAALIELRTDSAARAQYSADDLAWLDSHLKVLDMLNTKYVIDDHSSAPAVNTFALGNAWFVDTIAYVNGADAEMAALDNLNPATEAVADEKFRTMLGDATPADTTDSIVLTSYAPDRLTYESSSAKGGLAVFSEVYYPHGWTLLVDGQPVEIGRVNYLLRAARIPAGTHKLEMTFAPATIAATNGIAYAAISLVYLLLLAGIACSLRRRK